MDFNISYHQLERFDIWCHLPLKATVANIYNGKIQGMECIPYNSYVSG